MAKEFTIKIRGMEPFTVSEDIFRTVQEDLEDRRDVMIKIAGRMFNAKNFEHLRSQTISEAPPGWEEAHPEITDEMRAQNIKRLEVIRALLFNPSWKDDKFVARDAEQQRWYDEWKAFKETGDYPKSGWRGRLRLNKTDYRAFQKEFFDVYIPDHEFEELLCRLWLPYHRQNPNIDPRKYDRARLVAMARKDYATQKEAEHIFGVPVDNDQSQGDNEVVNSKGVIAMEDEVKTSQPDEQPEVAEDVETSRRVVNPEDQVETPTQDETGDEDTEDVPA